MKRKSTQMIVTMGLLVALHIILSRFVSINAWNIKIGPAFVATFTGAYLFGPLGGIIVGGLGDFLGAILFPIGPYFPGFTLNCALTGLIFGLFLYKKQTLPRIMAAVLLNELVVSLCITPLWISILYGSEYWPIVVSRIPQIAIMLAVELATIIILAKIFERINAKGLAGSRRK